jgi:NADPH2:quinone reductase
MQVAVVTRLCDPDVLVTNEAPDLAPGRGEAVVEVAAADVLSVEAMIRRSGGGEYST